MAKIIATGTPEKYPELGEIRITVKGTDTEIQDVRIEAKDIDEVESFFDRDMDKGPTYPLCAEPNTMRCALFVLFEWFGEAESCLLEEPTHVKLEGEIEPMESEPGVVY